MCDGSPSACTKTRRCSAVHLYSAARRARARMADSSVNPSSVHATSGCPHSSQSTEASNSARQSSTSAHSTPAAMRTSRGSSVITLLLVLDGVPPVKEARHGPELEHGVLGPVMAEKHVVGTHLAAENLSQRRQQR